ncbi:uncharacterized protein LOC129282660 isoform X2 [Lytechinus pictus]|uniref:uncharacterized protein LOC129282660 isoform X2 n=1 Tax=Lytechinus pictus TaxID=7653 RepID=UPI0030BA1533
MGDSQTFDAAETNCMSSGGRLAIIRSTELNTLLTSIVSPALSSPHCYWFGLSRLSDNDQFIWSDGTQLSNSMWIPGEPSRFTGRSCGCLGSDGNNADNHGRWDSRTCLDALPYICERPQVQITGQWIYFPEIPNVQYYFSTFTTSYFIASEYCQQIGGRLAQIKTKAIYTAVTDHFVVAYWFGLDDLSKEGDFRWSDGTFLQETGFATWAAGEPNNNEGAEHCVEYWDRSGGLNEELIGWNDRLCDYPHRFICEKSEVKPKYLLAMTSSPFGSTETPPSFSCVLSPDNIQDTITYTEREVRPSLTTEGYSLDVPGTNTSRIGGFTQNLPGGTTSVGVYKCSSTSTITGTSTSVDVTILSQGRHFQPSDGRLTKTVYPGDDITLSVSTTDRYSSGSDEIRWSTFSNLAEGSLSPNGDGTLTYTILSATKRNADVYGTFQNNAVDNRLYSLIRVIVSDCPRGRWNLPLCDRLCDNCYNGGICHPQSGTCICPPGFIGKNCLTACGKHRFGWGCELECGAGNALDACSESQVCLPDPYGCNCLSGYTGIYCDEQCPPEKFGVDCLQDCHCAEGIPCDAFTGRCEGSCEDGWSGVGCQVPSVCPTGYTGITCTEFCNCPDHSKCEKKSGFCTSTQGQCKIGYVAEFPETPDRCSTYSGCFESCSKTCHCAGGFEDCDQETGMCSSCHPRWMGDNCQIDRFTVTREKANPGVAIFSCAFTPDSPDSTLVVRASIGDLSSNSLMNEQGGQTPAEQPSVQSNFTLFSDDIETQPIYCFVGDSTSDGGFAYARLSPSGTFALPVIRNQPRIAELGFNHAAIAWDPWNPSVDVGDGPVVGYKVYVTSSDGNETNTFITASGVPSASPGSVPSRKRRGYEGSIKFSYEMFTTVREGRDGRQIKQLQVEHLPNETSRKKRQGDLDILMYNITDLDQGQSYEIRISAVREGLSGEGEKSPALSLTTREISVDPLSCSSTIGRIIGGAIGGIIILLLIAGLVIMIVKKRRGRSEEVSESVTYKNDGFIEVISTGQETDQPSQRYENLGHRKPMDPSNQIPMPDLPTRPTRLDEGCKPTQVTVEGSPKDRRLIPVSKFATFVDNIKHTDSFYEDFRTLARICPDPPASLIKTALKKENRSKSRSANSHPLDRNRVILESLGSVDSDFIDASYVKGIRYRFITTQMPMPNTIADFWNMVFHNQPSVIIMLNDDDRRNKSCAQYWLDKGVATFGSFSITTVSVSENEGLIEREMQVTRNNSKAHHIVKQYQFLDWPNETEQQENRAPQLIDLMTKVQETLKRSPEGFPVLVHCMNGVGRTGVFCSTLECIAQVNEEDAVDVFHVVKMLRNERMNFVQTEEEYSFIHELIKEYIREHEYEEPLPEVSPNDHTYTYVC